MSEMFSDLTVNDDGSRSNSEGVVVNRPWMDQNPDDLKVSASLAKHATLGDMSRAYADIEGEVGKLKTSSENTIQKLGENPSTEQVSAYNEAIGVPKSAEDYNLSKPELPDGYEYSEGFEQHFRKIMFDSKMPKEAVEKMYPQLIQYGADKFNENKKKDTDSLAESQGKLKTSWGSKHDENIVKRDRSIKRFAGDNAENIIKDADAIPEHSDAWFRVFEAMGEDFFLKGEKPQQTSKTPTGYDGKTIFDYSKSMGTGVT